MIQIAARFSGLVAPCPTCTRQPLHIEIRGRTQHALECPPCQTRTARFATAQEAVAAWEIGATALFDNRRIA